VYTTPVSERHTQAQLVQRRERRRLVGTAGADRRRLCHAHEITVQGNHAVLISAADPDLLAAWLARNAPMVAVLSVGQSIDLYKDVGAPRISPTGTLSSRCAAASGGTHPHGDRIGRDPGACTSVHCGTRLLPGAQRFAVQSTFGAQAIGAARHRIETDNDTERRAVSSSGGARSDD